MIVPQVLIFILLLACCFAETEDPYCSYTCKAPGWFVNEGKAKCKGCYYFCVYREDYGKYFRYDFYCPNGTDQSFYDVTSNQCIIDLEECKMPEPPEPQEPPADLIKQNYY